MGKLELAGISKSFAGHQVLRDVSLTVEDGEFVALLGSSGSGKSTVFHLIGGLYRPDAGRILLDGSEITGRAGSIAYMPQQPSLLPWRTVADNVRLGAELAGQPNLAIAEMLQKAGLAGYEGAYPRELSGGMRQRVAFLRALASPQPLLCLDEPFSALDEFRRLEMQNWLLSIWQEARKSVLFVTHSIDEALYIADRILVLGGSPASIAADRRVPFARPREEALVLSAEFLQEKRALSEVLRRASK